MLCRICRQGRPTASGSQPSVDAPSERSHPGPEKDDSAVLLLRVWRQDGDLRCRLMSVTDSVSAPSVFAVAQGVDAIDAAVRQWLLRV
jgi:hypothetical protein